MTKIEKARDEINRLLESNLPLDLIYMRIRMLREQIEIWQQQK